MCSCICAEQWQCCISSCVYVSAGLCGHSGSRETEAEFCTAHKAATLRLLQCFCLVFSTHSIFANAFWYFVSGLMCTNWSFHPFLFWQTLCCLVKQEVFNSMRSWFSNLIIKMEIKLNHFVLQSKVKQHRYRQVVSSLFPTYMEAAELTS